MNIVNRVRRIYERRPYPPVSLRGRSDRWVLPALEWVDTVRESPVPPVRRILTAGCGVGTEAFAMARQFPDAEVVGVDFSPRSIATAKRLRDRAPGADRIRFETADLTDENLREIAGGRFDLVSCHGVLSYVPDPEVVLRNLSRCMHAEGALIVGVNGVAHPSLRFRHALPSFGIDVEEFRESARTRSVLALLDALLIYPPVQLADQTAGYLAGDIFGPLNHAFPLEEWVRLSRAAGLHFRASLAAGFALRNIMNRGHHALLMPRSRADVSRLVDLLQPASFHRMVFCKRRLSGPAWDNPRSLLRWRPVLTPLYSIRLPAPAGSWTHLKDVTLESRAINTKVTLHVPRWEAQILREARGKRTVREILSPTRSPLKPSEIAEQLYLLYQLGAINLLP